MCISNDMRRVASPNLSVTAGKSFLPRVHAADDRRQVRSGRGKTSNQLDGDEEAVPEWEVMEIRLMRSASSTRISGR